MITSEYVKGEFYMERILLHQKFKYKLSGVRTLYLVKWKSYSIRELTWEPLENVKENDSQMLEDYLKNGRETDNYSPSTVLEDDNDRPTIPAFNPSIIIESSFKTNTKTLENEEMFKIKYDNLEFPVWELRNDVPRKLLEKYRNRITGKKRKRDENFIEVGGGPIEEPPNKKLKLDDDTARNDEGGRTNNNHTNNFQRTNSLQIPPPPLPPTPLKTESVFIREVGNEDDIIRVKVDTGRDSVVFIDRNQQEIELEDFRTASPQATINLLADSIMSIVNNNDWIDCEINFVD